MIVTTSGYETTYRYANGCNGFSRNPKSGSSGISSEVTTRDHGRAEHVIDPYPEFGVVEIRTSGTYGLFATDVTWFPRLR